MFFDALTIAAARDEMLEKLVPGRVQQVRAVAPLSVALEIYGNGRRRYLLLSAHAQYARAHLLSRQPSRDPGVRSPMLLLLRKYIRGAVLQSIEQPDFERVLVFNFTKVLPADRDAALPEDEAEEIEEGAYDPRADIPPGFALFETRIIAEIMGRHSNIVLVGEDGIVLDAIKRVPSSINRVRTTLPRQPYISPPAQRKFNLLSMGETSFEGEMHDLDPKTTLTQALVARFRSVSPLLAQEAVFRAGGTAVSKVTEVESARLYRDLYALLELAETAEWSPTIAWAAPEEGEETEDGERAEDEGTVDREQGAEDQEVGSGAEETIDNSGNQQPATSNRQPLAFAPYPLHHLAAGDGELQEVVSISRAAEQFYAAMEQVSGHAQLRADVLAEIRVRRDRLDRRVHSMQVELDRAAGFEQQRHKGELLLAYMYILEPGQLTLEIPEEKITIKLDPDRTPLEQAQAMFREYQRARAAVAGVPARIEMAELGLRYLDELTTALELADDFDTIQTVRADLLAMPDDPDKLATWQQGDESRSQEDTRKGGKAQNKKGQAGRKGQPAKKKATDTPSGSRNAGRPVQLKSSDGIAMLYGRSARENDALTFGLARPGDLWLHARGVPGSHVVVRSEGRQVPESTVVEAARLAARHSKARNERSVDVIIAERRNVRRIPGAPPGLVTVSNERVLRVRIDEPKS